jgi:hypothetical protein
MARFVNDHDYPLRSFELGRDIGPHEEFDFPGYDPETHGVVPGCRRLDETDKPARRTRSKSDTGSNDDTGGDAGQVPAGTTASQSATGDAEGDASKENPQ